LYLIKSGRTSVTIQVANNQEREIAQMNPGDFFGEMAIFENSPRSARCTALTDCEIYKLHKNDFFDLMQSYPETAIAIMRNILDAISKRINEGGHFIASLVKWGEEARLRSITDKHTGLYNRRYLESELSKAIELSKTESAPFSLIMADMDFFREVNESYSHEIGDEYILQVARVFQEGFRNHDVIARYGGDEFTILMPNTKLSESFEVADNIRKKVNQLNFLEQYDGPPLKLSVSFGLVNIPENAADAASATKLADQALYVAKNNGRNQTAIYSVEK